MYYYQVDNPGIVNWISHQDNQIAQISQYMPNIWVTENTEWAARVGATELSKSDAQTVCDTYTTEQIVLWEACCSSSLDESVCGPRPEYTILP